MFSLSEYNGVGKSGSKAVVNIILCLLFFCSSLSQAAIGNKFEALAMNSSDGETVQYIGPTLLDGPVEVTSLS